MGVIAITGGGPLPTQGMDPSRSPAGDREGSIPVVHSPLYGQEAGMADAAGLLRAALGATGDGVGCHYRLRAEVGLGTDLLAELGLVKPIRQRIPDCSEHACPLRDGCRHAIIFAEARAGRSGKKYRLAPLGERALADDHILAQVATAAQGGALARRVLAALAEGPRSIFALNTILLDQSLAALHQDGEFGEASFDRGGLAATLALLRDLGTVVYDGATVALPLAGSPPSIGGI